LWRGFVTRVPPHAPARGDTPPGYS
jgi:hypothetical protein